MSLTLEQDQRGTVQRAYGRRRKSRPAKATPAAQHDTKSQREIIMNKLDENELLCGSKAERERCREWQAARLTIKPGGRNAIRHRRSHGRQPMTEQRTNGALTPKTPNQIKRRTRCNGTGSSLDISTKGPAYLIVAVLPAHNPVLPAPCRPL
jgi:hypothetical protein